jgi:hypothetical protein
LDVSFSRAVDRFRGNDLHEDFISAAKHPALNPPHMFSLPADKPANRQGQFVCFATTPAHIINNRAKNTALPETRCAEFSAIQMHLEGFRLAI